jgi:hypothetical protein
MSFSSSPFLAPVFHFFFHDLPNYWDLLLERMNPLSHIFLVHLHLLLIIANLNLYLYLNPTPNLITLITWTGIASVSMET